MKFSELPADELKAIAQRAGKASAAHRAQLKAEGKFQPNQKGKPHNYPSKNERIYK